MAAGAAVTGRDALHELTLVSSAREKPNDEHRTVAGETVDQVHQRHCAHYSAFLHEQMKWINYHQDVVDNVMMEFGDLQAAWDWTVAHGDVQDALNMVVNLLFLAEMAGWYHFVARVYKTAAAQLRDWLHQISLTLAGARLWLSLFVGSDTAAGTLNHLGLVEKARASVEANYAAWKRWRR